MLMFAGEPILFIVSPGADPSSELQELVTKLGVVDKEQFYEVQLTLLAHFNDLAALIPIFNSSVLP